MILPEEVKIEISSKSNYSGESTTGHSVSFGKCYFKNKKIYISYNEKLDGIDSEIPSLMTLDENYLQISRRGEVRSTMTFMYGENTECTYVTGPLALNLIIHTTRYAPVLGEMEVTIYLDYDVIMNGEEGGHNSVIIKIG